MQKVEEYESRKKKLRDYFQNLDQKCKVFVGPHTKYSYPVQNPYVTYADIDDFKNRVIPQDNEKMYLIKQKVCKFSPTISRELDKKGRYYIEPRSQEDCKKVEGFWDPKGINRNNRYDLGICWKDNLNKVCGQQIYDDSVLRPYRTKFDPESMSTIATEAERCKKHPDCTWEQQSAFTFDCVPGRKSQKTLSVSTPPESMPLFEFESFLEQWYGKGLPSKAPATMKLIGEGDRCKGLDNIENLLPPPPPLDHRILFIDYRLLDPSKEDDKRVLQETLKDEFVEFMTKYKNKDTKALSKIYNKLETNLIEHDYSISVKKDEIQYSPSIPQSVVNMVMKNIAIKHGKNRGLLAWHSTGSGKTATATGVIDSFWDDTDRRIVFASSLDAIASNPDWKFHQCAQKFFPRFDGLSLEIIAELFKKRGIKFYSFAKLSNRVAKAEELKKSKQKVPQNDDYIDLDKCILIIDEVHNLFRPLPTQQQQHEYLESQLVDPKKHPTMKIVILTATPGDNIPDVLKLLNIIRNSDAPIIKAPNTSNLKEIDHFKKQIRGLISFFDMSGDNTKFPVVYDSEPIKYPLSEAQFQRYVDAYKTVSAIQQNYDKLSKKNQVYKYWAPARKYANTLFNMDKHMKLSDFSSKIPPFLQMLKKHDREKHYLYTAFYTSHGYGGHGAIAIGKELEKVGYKKLTFKEAQQLNKAGKLPSAGKRYILATNSELGDDTGNNLAEMIKLYNHPENKDGKYVHLIVASQGYNEGIDLKAVRHIHIFEPLITMASDKQTIGRAARSCSHEDLIRNNNEWTVHIHRYMSDYPVSFVQKETKTDKDDGKNLLKDNDNNKNEIKTLKEKLKEIKVALQEDNTKAKAKTLRKKAESLESNIFTLTNSLLTPKRVKELKDASKLQKTANLRTTPLIEEKIFKESRERMMDLMTIYQCMQEAAIDCRLLNQFHAKTGHKIKCEF
jgi:hypothetical protein